MIQHTPHVTPDYHVCARVWGRAAGKATIGPEFNLSAPPTDGMGLETYSVSCSWWLAASSRKPGCLPAIPGRRTTMTQGHQRRLHCFSPALPGGGRLRWACPTQAAAAALEHSKGRTAEMLFNAQARRQGPAGFSCWYSAESARASHVTPGRQAGRQTDRQPSGISSQVPCSAGIYQVQTPSSCPELSPAVPRTLCT